MCIGEMDATVSTAKVCADCNATFLAFFSPIRAIMNMLAKLGIDAST